MAPSIFFAESVVPAAIPAKKTRVFAQVLGLA
jgi:hypothetical protein